MLTQSKVKEISLLLTPENRQAVRSGSKTQTRRVIKLPSWSNQRWEDVEFEDEDVLAIASETGCLSTVLCPYGKKGDRFYLLEPTQVLDIVYEGDSATVKYLDGGPPKDVSITPEDLQRLKARKDWTKPCSSRFMLKSFARDWFVNDGVRMQRLQEISEEDAIAEGIESVIATKERFGCRAAGMLLYRNYLDSRVPWQTGFEDPIASFASLWDSINKDRGYSWDSDPWVWCISFKRLEA